MTVGLIAALVVVGTPVAFLIVLVVSLCRAAAHGDRVAERARREALVRIQSDRGNGWRT